MYSESVAWDHEHCCILCKGEKKVSLVFFSKLPPELRWFVHQESVVFSPEALQGPSGSRCRRTLAGCSRPLLLPDSCVEPKTLLISLVVLQNASVVGPPPWPWPLFTLTCAEPLSQLCLHLSFCIHVYVLFCPVFIQSLLVSVCNDNLLHNDAW